ncbi:hypothetical protein M1D49_07850 [Bacillus sp. PK3-056]|uniref:hypothetical protein n=1 Tax=Niallia circulans TaxID=1397 RepID=UPI000F44E236|nr:hypothetical protein [Niallia circulans]AYV74270.1 hypothetical protein C2H98_23425 [Niallia circulans]
MLTTEQLNAIKERAEKATAGPWEVRKWSVPTNDQFFVRQSGESETKEIATAWQGVRYPRMPEICGEEAKSNAIFIAHSRTDIPALIAEVERLQKENAFRQKLVAILSRDIRNGELLRGGAND